MKSVAITKSGDTYTNATGAPLSVTVGGGSPQIIADAGTFTATDSQDIVIGPDPSTAYATSLVTDHGTIADGDTVTLAAASMVFWETGDYEGVYTTADDIERTLGASAKRGYVAAAGAFETPIAANAPEIATTTLTDGTDGASYTATLEVTNPGTPAATAWTITAGSLPTGLSLTDNGTTAEIGGTPTGSVAETFSVQYERADGLTASQEYTLTISASGPPTFVTAAAMTDAYVGYEYTRLLIVENAGTPEPTGAWTVTAGALPTSMALEAVSPTASRTPRALLVGTPPATESYSFTLQYERDDGSTVSRTFTGDVVTLTAAASPHFEDDFESGDILSTGSGFAWGNNGNQTLGPNFAVVTDQSYAGTYSLRARHPAKATGLNSVAEQRFRIAAPGREDINEIWIEWRQRIPTNYEHRDESGSQNNKLLALWAENYDDYGSNPVEGGDAIYQTQRINDDQSYVELALMDSPEYQFTIQTQVTKGVVMDVADGGTWKHFRFHLRVGDRTGTPTIFKMFVDGVLVSDLPKHHQTSIGFRDYFRKGYLFGEANTGYTAQTDFYIDDFKVWDANPGWGY